MKSDILVILPFKDRGEEFCRYNREEVFSQQADIGMLQSGERTKETPADTAITMYEELKRIVKAEEEGYQAILIGCYLDPGLREAREVTSVPVYGVADISLRVCAMLGQRIGIITTSVYAKRGIEANLREAGMDKCAMVCCVDMNVEEVLTQKSGQEEFLVQKITECMIGMIRQQEIDVFTFGSGALYRYYNKVKERMLQKGYDIPVVWANRTAVEIAKTLARLGYGQSGQSYPHLGDYEGLEKSSMREVHHTG